MVGWNSIGLGLLAAASSALLFATPASARQPVAEWRLDEGAGAIAGDSGPFGLAGALSGPSWISGVEGTALRFDSDDQVALPDNAALEPARITVAAWVRRTGTPGAYRYVLSKGASSCLRSSYGLYTGEHGGAAFYVAGDGHYTVSPEAAPATVWDGRWHRLTGSYDGARVRLYVDGVQVGAGASAPTHIEYGLSSQAPYLGTYHGDCDLPLDGDIDRVTVWDAALTAAETKDEAVPPPETPSTGPIGPAPGASTGAVEPGYSATPPGCTSVKVSRRSVRIGRRARIVVTVRKGIRRVSRARVVVRAPKLHRTARTDRRGRARFFVRASRAQPRLVVKALTRERPSCGKPVAHIRVRR